MDNKVIEGVGRKIVEALKQQNDIEITPQEESSFNTYDENDRDDTISETTQSQTFQGINDSMNDENSTTESNPSTFNFSELSVEKNSETGTPLTPQPALAFDGFSDGLYKNQAASAADFSDVDDMVLPSNIAILKQLITKLPANVSKQTGALIIKQTMEALGISMNNVLNEAQQVQEDLNHSARECQNSIVEYRKQISILEAQTRKYQRQYAAVNDIISLFIQTN